MISYLPKLQAKDLYIYIERERERERERFCKCDAKWLEHSQRCSGCDSAKNASWSRNAADLQALRTRQARPGCEFNQKRCEFKIFPKKTQA